MIKIQNVNTIVNIKKKTIIQSLNFLQTNGPTEGYNNSLEKAQLNEKVVFLYMTYLF